MKNLLTLFVISFLLLISFKSNAQNLEIIAGDSVYCGDDSVYIQASAGFASYDWVHGPDDRIIWVYNAGTYYLYATDTNNQTQLDSITIRESNAPEADLEYNNDTICFGDSFHIEENSNFDFYYWSYDNNGQTIYVSAVNKLSMLLTASTSLEFYAYKDGCDRTETLELVVLDCDSVCHSLLHNEYVHACDGDSVVLEAKNGYSNYKWSDGKEGRIRWVKESGWYVLSAEINGDTCIDSVFVEISTVKMEYELSPDKDIYCKGSTVEIEVTGGLHDYDWTTDDDDNVDVVELNENKTIQVYARDSNGCKTHVEIELYVQNCDTACEIIEIWPKATACDGDSINLEGKLGYANYRWSDGKEGRIRWVKETGWYTLRAISSGGDTCVDSVYVEIKSRELEITIDPDQDYYCVGSTIYLNASSGFKHYDWSTGDDDAAIAVQLTTVNTIGLVAEDSNGCEFEKFIEIPLTNCDSTCSEVIIAVDTIGCQYDSVKIGGQYQQLSYQWSTGSNDRTIYVKEAGWYSLISVDANYHTCYDSIYIDFFQVTPLSVYTQPNPPVICPGDSVIIEVNNDYWGYGWGGPAGKFYGLGNRAVYKPTQTTEARVTVSDTNDCIQRREIKITVKDTCMVSIVEIDQNRQVIIYPNPASNMINIESQSPEFLGSEIKVFSIKGELVLSKTFDSLNVRLDLDLPNGPYIINVGSEYYRIQVLK